MCSHPLWRRRYSPSPGNNRAGTVTPQAEVSVPRTPWGVPDLQGRWTNATVTLLERPAELGTKEFFTEAEAAEYQKGALERFLAGINFTEEAAISGEFVEGLWVEKRQIVPNQANVSDCRRRGPGSTIHAGSAGTSEARAAARKLDRSDGPEDRTAADAASSSWSAPPMLPGVGYNATTRLVDATDAWPCRTGIPLEDIPASTEVPTPTLVFRDAAIPGRWENDTLVVETTNFNDKRDLRGSGANLRLVERFRRVNADLMLYEFTAEDPSTWTKPWTAEIPMRKLEGLIYEFACHEGNYGLVNILKGARFAETQQPR